jgi:peptide/nickel transport system substrate-binding protein
VPFAGLLDVLAAPAYGNIIPVGYNPKAPVGTGPFKLGRFTPGVQSSFVRNPNYWQTGLPYVDELVITDFADDTSMLNALLGGQVDAVSLLSSDVLPQVTGAGKSVLISEGSGFNPFVMNTKASPFTDVRVRQAMRLIVDRNQMREIVFGGHGSIGNDVFGLAAPEYDSALPQRTQDIEQAKSLLKAAGHAGLAIELVTADVGQGVVESAQVFAQQAKAAGVSVSIRMITTTEYFGSNFLKWQFTQDFWYYYLYLPQVAFTTLSTATYNETNFSDPRYDAMYRAAQSTIDTQQRYAIEHEMMMIDYTEGGYIIPTFVPVIDGYSPTVHGIQQSRTGVPLNEFNFKRVWID